MNLAEIEQNDFNLNLPRYIDSQEPEDVQDSGTPVRGIPSCDIAALDNTGPFSPDSNPRSSIRSATTMLNYLFSMLN